MSHGRVNAAGRGQSICSGWIYRSVRLEAESAHVEDDPVLSVHLEATCKTNKKGIVSKRIVSSPQNSMAVVNQQPGDSHGGRSGSRT